MRSGFIYGFQGQEKDDEIKADGNSYTTDFRQYDPRLGRWLSIDPEALKYSHSSPYSAYENNPIIFIDVKGDSIRLAGTKIQKYLILWFLQKLTNDDIIMKNDLVMIKTYDTENQSKKLSYGTALLRKLIKDEHFVTIFVEEEGGSYANDASAKDATNGKGTNVTIGFDPYTNRKILTTDKSTGIVSEKTNRPHVLGLAHELIHTLHMFKGTSSYEKGSFTYKIGKSKYKTQFAKKEEFRTVGLKYTRDNDITENKIAEEQGAEKRGGY